MPKTKPTLISLEFSSPNVDEREITAVWTGTPEYPGPSKTYLGVLRTTGRIAIRDEYGDDQYEWVLETIPVKATFLVPTREVTDSRPVAAARWMIRAAYRAGGYGLWSPAGE
jgi:hypothetical protein